MITPLVQALRTVCYYFRVSALSLLFQLVENDGEKKFVQRFYQSLYLLLKCTPHIMPCNARLIHFFSLLYKALIWGKSFEIQLSFVHRLLQVVCCGRDRKRGTGLKGRGV